MHPSSPALDAAPAPVDVSPSPDAQPHGSEGAHTHDAIFGGRVTLRQARNGYRFGIDAVLLAEFAAGLGGTRALEVGAGSGVVSLGLLERAPAITSLHAVEVQASLHAHLVHNIATNAQQHRATAFLGDMRELRRQWKADRDLIVMNPPYFSPAEGNLAPDAERAAARHEQHGDLQALVRAARCVLAPRGQLAVVYPAASATRLLAALTAEGLRSLQILPIHAYADKPAVLMLVAARRNRTEHATWRPALVLYERHRVYTPAVDAWLQGGAAPWQLASSTPPATLPPDAQAAPVVSSSV